MGQHFWKGLKLAEQNERETFKKFRMKYFEEFQKKDLHFWLGTTLHFHGGAPHPSVIIGVFPIPYQLQRRLA